VRQEPIGVCGLITPWNFPINPVMRKVAPALAAGCTMVLKPSEISPLSALIIAEIIHDANDTPYGLAAYIQSGKMERARSVARRMRAGNVQINYPSVDRGAPFGGYKQSANGREWGEFGVNEYLEIKGIPGYRAA